MSGNGVSSESDDDEGGTFMVSHRIRKSRAPVALRGLKSSARKSGLASLKTNIKASQLFPDNPVQSVRTRRQRKRDVASRADDWDEEDPSPASKRRIRIPEGNENVAAIQPLMKNELVDANLGVPPAQLSTGDSASSPAAIVRNNLQALCSDNQPLIDALAALSTLVLNAQHLNSKLKFKGMALRKAAEALAGLEEVVTTGDTLVKGQKKVPGVGKATGVYIDEFLNTGEIKDIDKFRPVQTTEKSGTERTGDPSLKGISYPPAYTKGEQVEINRAPVLNLWVKVVAERQGFTSDEALTYGKWVTGILAHSKGRSLGIYESKHVTEDEREARKSRDERIGVHHVEAFGNMKIPVVKKGENRLAVSDGVALNPNAIGAYLERAFGDKLDTVSAAMKEISQGFNPEDLRNRAYHLYEQFRPSWKGWGAKGSLDLNAIRALAP